MIDNKNKREIISFNMRDFVHYHFPIDLWSNQNEIDINQLNHLQMCGSIEHIKTTPFFFGRIQRKMNSTVTFNFFGF